jgi:Ner family transcriptional regulator
MPKKGWHHADIVAAVRKKGTNLRQLSLANGKAESTLRAALLYPRTPSNRIISEFIGVPLHKLWPTWFDPDGNLIVSRNQSGTARRGESSRNRSAA